MSARAPATRRWVARVAAAVAVTSLLAPACRQERRRAAPAVEATSSRVDVFMRCVDTAARPIRFVLAGAELRDDSGGVRALEVVQRDVASRALERRTALAGAIVPPGRYVALVLKVAGAWLERTEGLVELELGERDVEEAPDATLGAEFTVPIDLRLRQRDALSVFLEWRAAESLVGGAGFVPALAAALEAPQTALGLLYVADAARGSVLAVERATGEVVGTYKTGASPSALVLLEDRRRLIAANAGDGSLSVLDLRLGRIVSSVPLAFGARTADVVAADPARWIAAANPGLDTVAFVALAADGGVQVVPVGREPVRLAAATRLRRLFVVERGNDSISVVDTSTRAVAATVAVESRPTDADVDHDERELFVGHETSQNLLVLDTRTLGIVSTIFVGGAVTDVLADPRRSRVYVARSRPPEVVVIERRVAAAVQRIPVSGRVHSMAIARDGNELYAAAPEAGAVLVIDVVTGREGPPIRCGARPTDVVIAE